MHLSELGIGPEEMKFHEGKSFLEKDRGVMQASVCSLILICRIFGQVTICIFDSKHGDTYSYIVDGRIERVCVLKSMMVLSRKGSPCRSGEERYGLAAIHFGVAASCRGGEVRRFEAWGRVVLRAVLSLLEEVGRGDKKHFETLFPNLSVFLGYFNQKMKIFFEMKHVCLCFIFVFCYLCFKPKLKLV